MAVCRSRARALAVASFVVSLSACPPSASTPKPIDTSTVKQLVGPAGGTLVHPTGAKLVVPAGALAADVELSITGAEAPAPSTLGAPSVGQAFVLGPDGQQFAEPLSITVPVDPALVQQAGADASDLRLRLAPQSTMAFVELATTADTAAQTLSAQLTHFSIIVPVVSASAFTFSTSGLPSASVGVAYTGALVVGGGTAPYVFSVVAGALPPGLALSAQGLLTGTPTQAGTYSFTVRVTDSTGAMADAVVALTVGGVGQCNDVPNAAGLVLEQHVASAAPAPAGGTLGVGTFVRSSTTVYTGPGGASGATGREVRQTIRITSVGGGLTFDSVYQEPGASAELASGSATTSGATLNVAFNCPASATQSFGYSATGTSLTLYEPVSEGTREMVFVLEGTTPDAGVDAGTPTDGGTQTCSGPAANGALVAEQLAAGTSSQAQGGVLPDGDYELVSDTVYESDAGTAGPTGNQRKQTFQLAGNAVSMTLEDSSGTQSAQFTIAFAGPTFVLTQTCPAGGSTLNFAYTMVAADRVELMRGSSRGTLVSTYQRVGGAGDAGTPDAGTGADAGVDVIGTGFTDLVDLAYDPAQGFLYTLGGGTVNRCDTAACGGAGTGTLVTNVYASSLAVDNGTLFVTTDFQNVKSCDATACSLTTFAALGANTYPAHLVVANNRVYWMSESGAGRRVQSCPLAGCGAGPTTVYSGAELDGVAVTGLAVTATSLYVSSFTGGVWAIPLSTPDTAGAATPLTGSAYGTGGLVVDGATLAWTEINDNRVQACTLPACASVTTVQAGLVSPSGLAVDAAYLYGADRGTPNGSGGYLAGTARVWRRLK